MKTFECSKGCGHVVMAQEKPASVRWSDGHTCTLVEVQVVSESAAMLQKLKNWEKGDGDYLEALDKLVFSKSTMDEKCQALHMMDTYNGLGIADVSYPTAKDVYEYIIECGEANSIVEADKKFLA